MTIQVATVHASTEVVLLVRSQQWYCAFPIASVAETCRPLSTQSVEGVPKFVRGVTVMRGQSTPVLHLGMMLSGESLEPGRRFVSARVNGQPVIFEVDETLGVRRLSREQLESTTPLVRGALTERIETLGVLDGKLLAWLDTARLVQHDLLDLVLSEGWT